MSSLGRFLLKSTDAGQSQCFQATVFVWFQGGVNGEIKRRVDALFASQANHSLG